MIAIQSIIIGIILFVIMVIVFVVGYYFGTHTIDHEYHTNLMILRRDKDRAEDANDILKLRLKAQFELFLEYACEWLVEKELFGDIDSILCNEFRRDMKNKLLNN